VEMPGFIKRLLRPNAEPTEEVAVLPVAENPVLRPANPARKTTPRARPAVDWEFRTAADAQCAIYALIIAGTEASRRPAALKFVAAQDGVSMAGKTRELFRIAVQLQAADRLPYIEDALVRLRGMAAEPCDRLLKTAAVLIDADKRHTLPKFTLNIILRARLLKSQAPPAAAKLARQDVIPEMGLLLSLMARAGADTEEVAARNLSRLMFQLTGQVADLAPAAELNSSQLTAALERMRQTPFMVRETLVQTLAECVTLDGKVKPMEAELLAAMAGHMGVPVPPLDLSKLSRSD